ncbi:MAG TPA: SulP family inorganic anion transporter [Gammaproteobacteria bacterium]
MKLFKTDNLAGDFWGALAAMLVALPSAIAFGVTIFAPLGSGLVAQGAIAGILGTAALGLMAPIFGGTHRLITAPCAPAAAVLAAVTVGLAAQGASAESALLTLTLIGLLCGALQLLFGLSRIGKLIKYMPYPVVSGYLSGVGLIIILSQLPKLFGMDKGTALAAGLLAPSGWQLQGLAVGVVTIAVMLLAPRVTRAVPGAILGLVAGLLAYFGLALLDRELLQLTGNALILGPVTTSDASFLDTFVGRWSALGEVGLAQLSQVIVPAVTLAVLLSIDTLKTCVVLDALTRSRHDSNRELFGQGMANLAATAVGGINGAGTMGATLVNVSGGAQTRVSGLIEGVLAIVAFLLLGGLIAWVPIAALAGILIVVGLRMIDWGSLQLLRARTTMLDFVVILSVVVTALSVGLIAASAVGVALAILLFIREHAGGSVLRRKSYGSKLFSKQMRLQEEMEILQRRGEQTAIVELQGSLFFGTTNQLYLELEPEIKTRRYVILDLRRVQTVDFTAAHMLEQIGDMLAERHGLLIFSQLPRNLPSGRDMQKYFDQVGVVRSEQHARVFEDLDAALEWVEDRLLEQERLEREVERPLELHELDLFAGRKLQTLSELEAVMERRAFRPGEKVCARGDAGFELYLIRRGRVRIELPLEDGMSHHLATFGRGDFFGEVSFLDRDPRSADAIAETDTELYLLSRERFDAFAEQHKKVAIQVLEGLARKLAIRLRYTNAELRYLQEA